MNEKAARDEVDKKVLSKFFDPYLLELLRSPVLLELRDMSMTVVFWDVSNFSRLCNKLIKYKEAITGFLREYFTDAVEVIHSHRGILDKFIGDGILAYFGYFDDTPDCGALSGINAALDLKKRFIGVKSRWTGFWTEQYNIKLSVNLKCGIHTCRPLFGLLESGYRSQITGIGPAVNFASRLEGEVASRDQVIISRETKNKLEVNPSSEATYLMKRVRPFPLKDKIKGFEGVKVAFRVT